MIPLIQEPNILMQTLFTGSGKESKLFRKNIRKYNTCLAFGSTIFKEREFSDGPPTVIVGGNIQHKIGSLIPEPSKTSAFMQCYFYQDGENQNSYFHLSKEEVIYIITYRINTLFHLYIFLLEQTTGEYKECNQKGK